MVIADTSAIISQTIAPLTGGALIGGVMGYGLKKLLKLVFKVALVVLGSFFAGIMFLQARGYLTGINWNKMGNDMYQSVNGTVTNISHGTYNDLASQILHNLGIPMTSGIAMGFVAGWWKG
jgi:uncharacterized membrane protein (Fun14 family)